MNKSIRIGSRGSDLALWQAHYFQDRLKALNVPSEIIIITTKGDRIQDLSFDKIEGKGFFTKEIEEALLNDEIDVAIHSHKDLETRNPEGLHIAGVSYREDPSELLLIRKNSVDPTLPLGFKTGAVIGTSSARRKSIIKSLRSDITLKDIRGNVLTRVNKLREGQFDAILLAFAGVHRLKMDLSDLHVEKLDPRLFVPAPAQGVLAYQCRENDIHTTNIIRQLHDDIVANTIAIERGILASFGGGCQIPIGVHASSKNESYSVRVSYAENSGSFCKRLLFEAENFTEALSTFNRLKPFKLPESLFFSRDPDETSFISRACESHGVKLTAQSLIETHSIDFHAEPTQVHWLFFSSSNSARCFFSQVNLSQWKDKKIACVGAGTAQTVGKYVDQIHFVGEESDTDLVAKAFKSVVKDDRVLFPISAQSLQSIPSVFPKHQVDHVVCYETHPVAKVIDTHHGYIFTSPSNVDAFFAAGNHISNKAKVISIGKSTASRLHKHGYSCAIAEIPHEAELFALFAS